MSNKKKFTKKIIKPIIGITLVLSFLTIIIYTYYDNKPRRYDYSELPGGIDVLYEDDMVRFAVNFTPGLGINYMGEEGHVYLYDDGDTKCYRQYLYFSASHADVRDNSKYHIIDLLSVNTNGTIPGMSDQISRTVEICYLNSDGSVVTLWQRED